jgi:hypothetical protein
VGAPVAARLPTGAATVGDRLTVVALDSVDAAAGAALTEAGTVDSGSSMLEGPALVCWTS